MTIAMTQPMLMLGINTVGNVCEAPPLDNARVIASRSEPMEQRHDERLALRFEPGADLPLSPFYARAPGAKPQTPKPTAQA